MLKVTGLFPLCEAAGVSVMFISPIPMKSANAADQPLKQTPHTKVKSILELHQSHISAQ